MGIDYCEPKARPHGVKSGEHGSYSNPIDLDEQRCENRPQLINSKKRKFDQSRENERHEPKRASRNSRNALAEQSLKKSRQRVAPKSDDKPKQETRLRRFRPAPPISFQQVAERAFSQRLCVLERNRFGTGGTAVEEIEIAGSTGNVYTVKIRKIPSCNCPHALKGNQCKHIVYCMARTLKARSNLVYQLALTSTELAEVFANAPPPPSSLANSDSCDSHGNRKPIDDDCPICYDSFSVAEPAVWCQDGCGNNIHSACFEKWATQKRIIDGKVTCPFCRALWKGADTKVSKGAGKVNAEGYRNVADELGMSGRRDYSTYNQFWVRRQQRERLIDVEEDFFGS